MNILIVRSNSFINIRGYMRALQHDWNISINCKDKKLSKQVVKQAAIITGRDNQGTIDILSQSGCSLAYNHNDDLIVEYYH